ncbi:putative lipid II flippase FtsW [Eubacterium sp.]|uniref:putative lipid II flippase FtsW n=1 Tax=Eubacterium sp. TaxID=142586 RepID=UPI0025BF5A15|nr:putative lipid II flippase FtsW [Eubacterium sp.]MCI7801162.1 putative lipid II flippase FtsW [Eubacterium sp.]
MPDNLPKPKPSLRDKQAQYDNKKVKKHSKKQARSQHLSTTSKLKTGVRNSFLYAKGGFDVTFFAAVLALMTIGLVMLFSASYPYAYQKYNGDSYYFFKRQLIFAVLGVIVMIVVSKINYKWVKIIEKPLFVVTVFLLVLVLFYHVNLEDRSEDFKRWIPLGPITLQPSDIAKFSLVLTLSAYIGKYRKYMQRLTYGVLFPGLIIGLFCVLIYLENHLSCTVLMFMIGITLMFCGGTRWQWFVGGLCVVGAVAFVIIKNPDVLPSYQADRIRAWTDKTFQPLGLRWQTNNSLYAIGSGGFFGVGLGNSKQKYLYVSEPQNDFIFSIVCEELGFLGAMVILALFALLFWRGIKIAQRCDDKYAALVVIGIVSQVAIQTLFNVLVVTDTFPNTGIALPFFSYGGTALLMLCFEMGVVLSVSRKVNTKKL